jgi:hypothetical protein
MSPEIHFHATYSRTDRFDIVLFFEDDRAQHKNGITGINFLESVISAFVNENDVITISRSW